MEAARAAVAKHTSRRGHKTDVEEIVRPAITSETIKPHRHEIVTEAVDHEEHRHHYHTTVQPLSHTVTLPAKHTHNLLAVKKTELHHEDHEENERKVALFAAQFKNHSVTLPHTHSHEHKGHVVGEHVHHHVHETVIPVIYKETIQREHVHTTLPIREVHHQKAKHHGLSSMPLATMEEFIHLHKDRKNGEVRRSHHEGAPHEYDSKMLTTFEKLGIVGHHHESETTSTKAANLVPINTEHATPTRHSHHRSGSDSSASSASDSGPSTPTSPRFNSMLPKGNTVTSPTHTTNTFTPSTHINTQTTTTSTVNRVPAKHINTARPVQIANADGEVSPRYSSGDEVTPRRSLVGRLAGSRRAY